VTLHNNHFCHRLSDDLHWQWRALHKSSIHVCVKERYVYTLSQIKTV